MDYKHSKANRILDLYQRLCEGKTIQKAEDAQHFGVDERSVQRDIDDIRAYLEERTAEDGDGRQVVYDRKKRGFVLTGHKSPIMSNSEILAVSKILLESRAFPKRELSAILDKLVSGCVPSENIKLVTDLLANEKYHYIELTHTADIQGALWDLGVSIQQRNLLEITYRKQWNDPGEVSRIVEPAAILFSEYYFYLSAYLVDKKANGSYARKHDSPAIFRVDRIVSYRIMPEQLQTAYMSRFQEGEFRKRVQFMYPGKLLQLRFRYTGPSVEAVLDRLPTSKIIEQNTDGSIVEAEVFGKGIVMWLLSQKDQVEVLFPESLRQEMRDTLLNMLGKYE